MQDILIVSNYPTTRGQVHDALRASSVDGLHARSTCVDDASSHLPFASFVVLVHNELDEPTREFIDGCQVAAPDVSLIVAGLPRDPSLVVTYLMLGVAGYVFAEDPPEALARAIQAASRGQLYVDPTTATAIVRQVVDLRQQLQQAGYYRFDGSTYEALTAREQEVLSLIVSDDLTNSQIAKRLSIEIGTVKSHVHNILQKLGVRNRDQAVRLYSNGAADLVT